MKYLDFAIQSIIIVFGILILIFSWEEPDWPLAVLYAQIMLGPWQMTSSIISIVAQAPLYRQKRFHLFIAILYLIGLYVYTDTDSTVIPHSETIFSIIFTVPAWALGIFYYSLTCRWVFAGRRKKGNFLPNLSF